jgi:dephospho-CoA kinase
MNRSHIIGLTGGIGMGKTTVSRYLTDRYHLPILDADIYAREAVLPDSPILAQIVDRYGREMLQPDGSLDRRRLGEIVFQSASDRIWLEQQIHPYVRQRMTSESQRLADPIQVFVIPLLFEANLTHLVNIIWVVYCSESQQIERLMQREKLTMGQAQSRIKSQMPIQEKCDRADTILDNSATPAQLLAQVDQAVNQAIAKLTNSHDGRLD